MTTKGNNGNNTFIKITNKDIFDKLEALEETVRKFNSNGVNEREKLSGRITMNRWLVGASLTIAGYAVIWLWSVVSGQVIN